MSDLSVASFVDAEKYGLVGLGIGMVIGSATEFISNALCDSLVGYDRTTPGEKVVELAIRGSMASISFVIASSLYGSTINSEDPTGSMMFGYGYLTSQARMYSLTLEMGLYLSDEERLRKLIGNKIWGGDDDEPCCGDCAKSGGSCGK